MSPIVVSARERKAWGNRGGDAFLRVYGGASGVTQSCDTTRRACAQAKRNALVVDALNAEELDELAEARDRVFLHLLERDEEDALRAELVKRARNARRW